jgi:hypothetical protein
MADDDLITRAEPRNQREEHMTTKPARYMVDWEEDIQDPICLSIVRALLDGKPTVSE